MSTPGTSVMAAPLAGQMITESDRASLRRMRSESMLSTRVSSPLVSGESFDSAAERDLRRAQIQAQHRLLDEANRKLQYQVERGRGRRANSLRTEERDSTASDETERGEETDKNSFESEGDPVTTPIPEWILGAAPRNSFFDYNKRKLGSTAEEERT